MIGSQFFNFASSICTLNLLFLVLYLYHLLKYWSLMYLRLNTFAIANTLPLKVVSNVKSIYLVGVIYEVSLYCRNV